MNDDGDGDVPGPAPIAATYDRIAEHFASTREYPWPEVAAFLGRDAADRLDDDALHALDGSAIPALDAAAETDERTDRAALGLDLGCGNGRHAEVLADVTGRVVGIDVSAGLLATASERALDRGFADSLALLRGDAGSVPLADDRVDVAVYVATLHHLRSRDRRIASLSELARVLAPGGRALVGVWSTAHDRFEADAGFDTTVAWTLPGGESVPRYYHIYDPPEFAADLDASDLRTVERTVSSGNCYAVVEADAGTDAA
ncbi:class I SAM-dependent methyltransferase [Halobellus clavatus]|jgi:SAM-dependent methyltransferase|uniref:Methyltransferase domain-containing protein n=1 Tax=Halobellus clavatus TaxID=660517 RepID=A0A1H3D528_9EURY|nr:class I SAM-dependent methyltransferase [Halobellus clavatus]SDX61420.1 Methyltransferase domain-containing protein [Halobellus clavatus]